MKCTVSSTLKLFRLPSVIYLSAIITPSTKYTSKKRKELNSDKENSLVIRLYS
jgi:hypothetical protein